MRARCESTQWTKGDKKRGKRIIDRYVQVDFKMTYSPMVNSLLGKEQVSWHKHVEGGYNTSFIKLICMHQFSVNYTHSLKWKAAKAGVSYIVAGLNLNYNISFRGPTS